MAVPMVSSAEGVIFGGFTRGVTFRRFFVTCRKFENLFVWQAQYFCNVFRRRVAVFVAGAALWTCPLSFGVAGAAL